MKKGRWMQGALYISLLQAVFLGVASCKQCYGQESSLRFEGMILEPGCSIRGVNVPIVDVSGQKLLNLQIGEIMLEPSKMGFLMINLLPQLVIRDLLMVVEDPGRNWGDALRTFLKDNGILDGAVIKGVKIVWKEPEEAWIEANSGQFIISKSRIALKGAVLKSRFTQKSFPNVLLPLGESWRDLRIETSGSSVNP
jgi:hypothetical protein